MHSGSYTCTLPGYLLRYLVPTTSKTYTLENCLFFHNIYFHSIMAEKSNTVKKTSSCNICVVDLGCYPETRNIKLIRLVGTLEDGLMPSSPTYFRIIHYLDDTVVAIQIRSG